MNVGIRPMDFLVHAGSSAHSTHSSSFGIVPHLALTLAASKPSCMWWLSRLVRVDAARGTAPEQALHEPWALHMGPVRRVLHVGQL